MKKSELKEAIKAEITAVLSEKMSPEEMDSKRRQAMRGGAKAEPLAKLATIGQKGKNVTIGDNEQEYKVEKVMANGDVLISRDGKNIGMFSPSQLEPAEGDIREEEMTDAEKKKAAEKDAKKEKDFANKQKEVDKLKKELADNKDELVKIAKISRNERTKAQQNLLDDMAKKTKELKKLKRVEI